MAQDIEQTLEDVKEFRKGLEDMLDKVDDVEAALDEAVGIQQQLQKKDDRIYELEDILEEKLTAEEAAEKLLEGYTGHKPSLGEVQQLKGIIEKALVEHFGVSEGTL